MKKTLLISAFIGLFSFSLTAQTSLQLLDKEMNDITNSEMTISGFTGENLKAYVLVKNNSGADTEVMVKKRYIQLVKNATDYFCWATCNEDPQRYVSLSLIIEKDSIADDFYRAYTANNGGELIVRYTFYLSDNESDSAYVDVTFDVTVGINDLSTNSIEFSTPYPNPANDQVNFDFRIHSGFSNARIVLYDLLGTKVKEHIINSPEGRLSISTTDLNNGIYFYSVIVNDKAYFSKKLVIKH